MDELLKERVIRDVLAYATEYKCDLFTSLSDWEGDGPNGSWGLTRYEREIVAEALGIAEEFSTVEEY